MSKGVIAVVALTLYFVVLGLANPYVGLAGYFGFVTLCPQWNWAGLLPEYDFQKLIAGATIIGLLATGMRGNSLRGPLAWSAGGLLMYLGISALSAFQSVSPEDSWWYMNTIWKIVLMVILGMIVLDEPKKLLFCMWVTLGAQSFNAMRINQIYLEQGFLDVVRFEWNYMTSNQYSIQSMATLAFAAALTLHSEKLWQRILAGVLALVQVHQLMLLESRGCMLAAVFMFFLGCFFMPKTNRTFMGMVLALMVILGLAGPPVVREFMSTFSAEEERDASARGRWDLWDAGLRITLDYPLLGAGPFAGDSLVPIYHRTGIAFSRRALHNLGLEVSTGSGIPALLCYVTFFAAVWLAHFRMWWKIGLKSLPQWAQCMSLATLAGIPGYWLANMFSSGSLLETGYCCAMIGAASYAVIQRELQQQDDAWWEAQEQHALAWIPLDQPAYGAR